LRTRTISYIAVPTFLYDLLQHDSYLKSEQTIYYAEQSHARYAETFEINSYVQSPNCRMSFCLEKVVLI